MDLKNDKFKDKATCSCIIIIISWPYLIYFDLNLLFNN